MASLAELIAVTKELRELEKGVVPSTANAIQTFVIGIPAATTLRFSLPSRCYWVNFASSSVSIYGAPVSSWSAAAGLLITSATKLAPFASGPQPLDLSDFSVFVGAANSGVTLTAFVQQSAPLAS